MYRSPQLAPLSREHQVALAVALQLSRATAEDVAPAVSRFAGFWADAGSPHFDAEERLLLPALASSSAGIAAGERMRAEHDELRSLAADLLGDAVPPGAAAANRLGDRLREHVRFEERELFPLLERELTEAQLDALGRALSAA